MCSRACDLYLQNPNFQSLCRPGLPYCPVSPSQTQRQTSLSCTVYRAADCVKATQTMFLLKACSSSHSCCLGLAGLTNAGLVLSPERALSQGVRGTRTHTVPSSCFSFTFNTTREREGQRREKWCAEKKRKKKQKVRRRRTKPMKRKANEQECKDDKGGERGRRCFESAA